MIMPGGLAERFLPGFIRSVVLEFPMAQPAELAGYFEPSVGHAFFAASCEKCSKASVIVFENDESVAPNDEVGRFEVALEPFRSTNHDVEGFLARFAFRSNHQL